MTSDWQFGLRPKRADQRGAALHRFNAPRSVAADFIDGVQAQVGQLALFGIAEQILDWIELGCISGQPLESDLPIQRLDIVAHHATAMRGQSIPDDQQFAFDLRLECLQEFDQLRALDRAVEETKVDLPEARTSDQRQLFPVEAVLQGRRAALASPSPDPCGSLAQSRFVDEDDGSFLASGVFFSAGQRLDLQVRIAASSRWIARPVGRWLEKPRARMTRQTCTELNEWPNSRLMSLPMRAKVHSSVGKPLANAPATNILLSFARSTALIAAGRPNGRRRQACALSATICAQRDTVWRLTSHERATSACTTPRASMRIPRRRRVSIALKSRLYRFVAIRAPRSLPTSINAHHSETVVTHLRNSQ